MTFAGLSCVDCSQTFGAQLDGICSCGGILLARYVASNAADGFRDLLPSFSPVSLGEAPTPLLRAGDAFYKDDGRCATSTFKARGAAVGVAMARELGAKGVSLPTAGNAGAAWAAYCAAAGLRCAVWAASDAPRAAVAAARAYGASVTVVPGGIGDAGVLAAADARDNGWHFAATFREPWRVEGKKTALFEVVASLGGRLPDVAVLPVGGGVGAVAWHKAAGELRDAGLGSGSMRIFAVQASGCAPIVRAFSQGAPDVLAWDAPVTAAAGIRIPSPLAGRLVLRALRSSEGGAISVSEESMLASRAFLGREYGISACLEAAAAWAGYEQLRTIGAIEDGETVVVYGTGSGLIDATT